MTRNQFGGRLALAALATAIASGGAIAQTSAPRDQTVATYAQSSSTGSLPQKLSPSEMQDARYCYQMGPNATNTSDRCKRLLDRHPELFDDHGKLKAEPVSQ
jgi:hypothetical protein